MPLSDKIDELLDIEERVHIGKVYGKEMEALDNAFDAISKVKNVKDVTLRKTILSLKMNIKYILGLMRNAS